MDSEVERHRQRDSLCSGQGFGRAWCFFRQTPKDVQLRVWGLLERDPFTKALNKQRS
jgi:hypothetical protein